MRGDGFGSLEGFYQFTQTTSRPSRTGTPLAVKDIWFPPGLPLAGIRAFTCQAPEMPSGIAETDTTVTPVPVTTGAELTPRPVSYTHLDVYKRQALA